VSRGHTVAGDFANLMMEDVSMMEDEDGESIEGWCLVKLRSFGAEEVAMVALLWGFEEGSIKGSSKSRHPLQASPF
jgi:hypothetical protein